AATLPAEAEAGAAVWRDHRVGKGASRCNDRRSTGLAAASPPGLCEQRADLRDLGSARPDAKKKSLRAAEQDRPDVAAARSDWRQSQPELDPTRLIFIDETWTKTNMTRPMGRAERGKRVVSAVPFGRWRTSTFIAGLRHDGLAAPCVFNGAINGELFVAYVEQVLAPTLTP